MKTRSTPKRVETTEIIETIDGCIASFLDRRSLPKNLDDAIRYAILGGGKRLRPVLAWRAAEACGRSGKHAIAAGIAVELVHAFSLVHDDLPAMDDDDMRRGRPTLHIHAGEPMAILAGDAMLTLAFEAITDPHADHDAEACSKLLRELCDGTRAMIVGQVHDTLGGLPTEQSAEEHLKLIHRSKTGALIRAACRMGAISASADDESLTAITRYADAIGLQFQIIDDLLDAMGDSHKVGKATGKDEAAGKLTYPGVLGIERSREIAARLHDEALEAAGTLGTHASGLIDLLDQLTNREH